MKSEITGTEFNNPEVCIKGDPNFACVCPDCIKEVIERAEKLRKINQT